MVQIVNHFTDDKRALAVAYAPRPADQEAVAPAAPLADSTLDLAHKNGLVEQMNKINAEEAQPKEEVLEKEEVKQVSKPADFVRKDPETKKKYQRIQELSAKAYEAQKERDAYALRVKELEMQLLSSKKEELDRDIDDLSGVMLNARRENDDESYIQANKLLNQFGIQKDSVESNLHRAQIDYKNYENEPEPDTSYSDENFYKISHKKELDSEHYNDWLLNNEIYNPYSEDFNPALTQEMVNVKNDYNNYLYVNRKQNMIGSAEYYDNLDRALDHTLKEKYSSAPFERSVQQNRKETQNYSTTQANEEDMSTKVLNRATVAPINRVSMGGERADMHEGLQLEPLTANEIALVNTLTFYKGQGTLQNKYGQRLSEAEKQREYQIQKAQMKARPRG